MYLDKILSDVPCSGDGTFKKNFTGSETWSPQLALGLHPMQFQIAKRGIELLKPGGRFVYSTCSFNPIENEAIIIRLLKHFGTDKLKLIDCSHWKNKGLKFTGGMTNWKVMALNKSPQKSNDYNSNKNKKRNRNRNRKRNRN
eukprot:Anaeramoba_flamelloidesa1055918_12.p2 GENE.a1055918_12~~a1055918_12.p2  ORF type:complete len:155 (-),score=25.61 a1055918_12:803-1228(-)